MFKATTIRNFKRWLVTSLLLLTTNIISFAQSDSIFWWNDAVFYEIFVRSFKDSDGNGKGDLKGLISKLDYLNDGNAATKTDLGITAIWLMPVMQSPSYHGYDVTDYKTIEQDYGTNQDFKDLITAAHNRGIKVIIDFVMNHTSSSHPWFVQSASSPTDAKRDWYVWNDSPPAITGPWGQQVWYSKNSSNYYAIFWDGMPDINYNNSSVKAEMFDAARFWLEDMDVDGFRLDAVRYILESGSTLQEAPETFQFWEDFRTYYKSVNADAFAVGEAWAATDIAKTYVSDTTLDYVFEFDLASAILTTAKTGNPSSLKNEVNKAMTSFPYLQFGTFLTNHDQNRAMNEFGNDDAKAKIASDLLLTLPGVPYIYYGEEIGMVGSGADENKRSPLQWDNTTNAGFTTGSPWRFVNYDYETKNIKAQQKDASSLWNNYRKMISLRNEHEALRKGTYKLATASASSAYSFIRQYNGETIIVISNTGSSDLSNLQISLSNSGITPGSYKITELRNGNKKTITVDNNGAFTFTLGQVTGSTTLIYRLFDATTTPIVNPLDENKISIYPVPTNKEVFIEYSGDFSGPVNYQLTDLSGALKTSSSFMPSAKAGQYGLSCEGLPSGVYILTLDYNDAKKVFRVVVQK